MTVTVQALLMSRDSHAIQVLRPLMEQSAIQVKVCSDARQAIRELCRSKFEAIVVDFAQPKEAPELIDVFHESPAHRKTILVVVSGSQADTRQAFRTGAHFVVERPLSPRVVRATLRACYSFMLREKSRYFRCPLQVSVHVIAPQGAAFVATSTNLSEGGLALHTTTPVKAGETLELWLALPGVSELCGLKAEVCWNDGKGRLGLQFVDISVASREMIQSWLRERMQDATPESVLAESSRKSGGLLLQGSV